MRKILFAVGIVLLLIASASGQWMMGRRGMMGGQQAQQVSDEVIEHTQQEEKEGEEVWEQLKSGGLSCGELSEGQFQALGEYFMGQTTGESHALMNQRMTQMMGEEGEEQMHVVMGKRLSGCDRNAYVSDYSGGMMGGYMMPGMIEAMMGGYGGNYGFWGPRNLTTFVFWFLALAGLISSVVWLYRKVSGKTSKESPVDALKMRYARGELNKKQFEEMRNELA